MRFTDLQRTLQPMMPLILSHPFNLELKQGTLPLRVFNRFLMDDMHYLRHFSKALSHIARRCESAAPTDADHFHYFAYKIANSEINLHRKHLKPHATLRLFNPSHPLQNPAVFAYTQHLHSAVRSPLLPAAIAAVLPCYYLYQTLGKAMPQHPHHPYHHWITTYVSPEFITIGNTLISIFNKHSQAITHPNERLIIENAFMTSVHHEIHFWDSCFHAPHRLKPVKVGQTACKTSDAAHTMPPQYLAGHKR